MNFYDIIDEKYFKEIIIEMAHHSTAIEGNTLSLSQTRTDIINWRFYWYKKEGCFKRYILK